MKVTFQIEGASPVTIECNDGDNLLELARRANVAIDAPCSGNGSCGKCRVKLVEGQLDTIPSRHITDEEYELGWRLSCNCKVRSDVTVFVPDIASAYQSRMKTADLSSPQEIAIFETCKNELLSSGIVFDNNFLALDVAMEAPTLDDTMPDNERLTWGIKAVFEVETVEIPFFVMAKLASTLRDNQFHVCVKGIHDGDCFRCMDVCPPEDTAMVGCAIDIGTTTVTMVLCDLATGKLLAKGSSGNGQIRYGADVINRIIQQGRPGGKKKLQDAILKETINPIIARLCSESGLNTRSILRLSIGANTTMNHLLLGVDAEPVRMEPYIPSFFGWEGLLAGDLKLPANPLAPVVIAPNIGSYVGGDITAGTLASCIWDKDEMSLFIDLGTNGELVYGNRDFLMSGACSAGPALRAAIFPAVCAPPTVLWKLPSSIRRPWSLPCPSSVKQVNEWLASAAAVSLISSPSCSAAASSMPRVSSSGRANVLPGMSMVWAATSWPPPGNPKPAERFPSTRWISITSSGPRAPSSLPSTPCCRAWI